MSANAEPVLSEPWSYVVDGETYEGRKVWHVEPPGPIGCGIRYYEYRAKDVQAEDGLWERHVYEWSLTPPTDEQLAEIEAWRELA